MYSKFKLTSCKHCRLVIEDLILYFCFILTASNFAYAQNLPTVTDLSLIRADNGAVLVSSLGVNEKINLNSLPTTKINLVAKTSTNSVRKIDFVTNGSSRFTDNAKPFAYKGDDGGNFNSWTPSVGALTISITAYDKETQLAGPTRTFNLTFTNENLKASPSPSLASSPTIIPTLVPTVVPTSSQSPTPIFIGTPTFAPTLISTPTPFVSATALPSATPNPLSVKAFPGAEGFGSNTVAGSGRHLSPPSTLIYKINNLNPAGPGSLKACVDINGPRTCIFEISGKIKLDQAITIRNPYLTIAGQTAPYPGIIIEGAGLQVRTHDVLIQHLRIRIGDQVNGAKPGERDGIVVWGVKAMPAYNVMIDRVSVTWAIDENFSTYGDAVKDVTISNSIIGEGLHDSIHPKGKHSKGMLIGEKSQNISVLNNLFAHNQDRNPRLLPGTSVEFISNFVYNWGGNSGWNVANISDTNNIGTAILFNFIGNNYKMGPDSTVVPSITGSPANQNSRVYTLDNFGPTRKNLTQNEWAITSLKESPNRAYLPAFPLSNVVPDSASDTPSKVLIHAGARTKELNYVDQRIKLEAKNGTGRIKDCLSKCSSPVGELDPDTSITRPLLTAENPFGDDNLDGYTNLEDWLHSFYSDLQ